MPQHPKRFTVQCPAQGWFHIFRWGEGCQTADLLMLLLCCFPTSIHCSNKTRAAILMSTRRPVHHLGMLCIGCQERWQTHIARFIDRIIIPLNINMDSALRCISKTSKREQLGKRLWGWCPRVFFSRKQAETHMKICVYMSCNPVEARHSSLPNA